MRFLTAFRTLLIAAMVHGTGCSAPAGRVSGPEVARVDLTRNAWFPPVKRQEGFSCSQQAGLYYALTCEWNQRHGRHAQSPAQRLSPYLAYSVLSDNRAGRSHVVDGWIMARDLGVPLEWDAPGFSRGLMHGYDRWHRAMQHRAAGWTVHSLQDEEGLARTRKLLAEGHPLVCDFQIKGTRLTRLPKGVHGAGQMLVKSWGAAVHGHAMVYAGYDDDIGFDFNQDGRITNDADITGDGHVTLADHERGAFLVINPWGPRWGDRGRAWAPYRHHATTRWPWARYVTSVQAAPLHQPRLTLRIAMRTSDRRNVRIVCGVAGKSNAAAPSRIMSPLLFSAAPAETRVSGNVWEAFAVLNRAGPHLSPGPLAAPGGGPLEMGLELTPLGSGKRYFLELQPVSGALRAEIAGAAFCEYDRAGRLKSMHPVIGLPAIVPPAGGVWTTR